MNDLSTPESQATMKMQQCKLQPAVDMTEEEQPAVDVMEEEQPTMDVKERFLKAL